MLVPLPRYALTSHNCSRRNRAADTPFTNKRTGGQDQDWNYWRAKHLRPASNTISTAVSCVPPRQVADFLVGVFFKYAETHHFYVEKAWLLKKLDALYTCPLQFGMKDVATISIILTVLAIGTQYAYLDSPGRKATESNTGSVFSEDELGALFYREAIRFLPEIIESSSLESVQACLLFAAYSLPIDAGGLGYIYINLTVRLAMQNGMHRKYTGAELGPAMVETRNRIWWTTYVLERYGSSQIMPGYADNANPPLPPGRYPSFMVGPLPCGDPILMRNYRTIGEI